MLHSDGDLSSVLCSFVCVICWMDGIVLTGSDWCCIILHPAFKHVSSWCIALRSHVRHGRNFAAAAATDMAERMCTNLLTSACDWERRICRSMDGKSKRI
mmetsp:Transcript_20754/g.41302  ORF Transcript_20754/g.41302 Transcript_20754/m.41302 type:complete len:100 (+) Transcript_20754:291-590(+)